MEPQRCPLWVISGHVQCKHRCLLRAKSGHRLLQCGTADWGSDLVIAHDSRAAVSGEVAPGLRGRQGGPLLRLAVAVRRLRSVLVAAFPAFLVCVCAGNGREKRESDYYDLHLSLRRSGASVDASYRLVIRHTLKASMIKFKTIAICV